MRLSFILGIRTRAVLVGFSITVAHTANAVEPFASSREPDSYVSARRYVSVDATADNADFNQFTGTGSFSFGKYLWLQTTLGKLTDDNDDGLSDLKIFGAGGGLRGEHLQLTIDFDQYKSDRSYTQRDWRGSLEWYNERFTIGIDAFHRDTDNSIDTTRSFPILGLNNVALHIAESIAGDGFGLHMDVGITDNLILSLSGIDYDYESEYVLTSTTNPILIRRVLTNRPSVAELLYLNDSGVTRALALLDSSYNAGLYYQFDFLSLSAQYFHDDALDSDDATDTTTLGADIALGESWTIAPLLGYSSSDDADSVVFGGLSISYAW